MNADAKRTEGPTAEEAVLQIMKRAKVSLSRASTQAILALKDEIRIDTALMENMLSGKAEAHLPADFPEDQRPEVKDFGFSAIAGGAELRTGRGK